MLTEEEIIQFKEVFGLLDKSPIFEHIINTYLVLMEIRPACLITDYHNSSTFRKQIRQFFGMIKIFLRPELLLMTSISKNRYEVLVHLKRSWVTSEIPRRISGLNSKKIGEFLGFQCFDHNFEDSASKRIIFNCVELFSKKNIITEVCSYASNDTLMNKHFEKIKEINRVLKYMGKKYKVVSVVDIDDGTDIRLEMIIYKNKDYIKKHFDEYLNDVYNYCEDPEEFEETETFKNFSNLEKLDRVAVFFKKMYNGFNGMDINVFDEELWSEKDVSELF